MSEIILPKTKVPASTVDPTVLLAFGTRKIGKTTMLSKLDNCLILDLEKGTVFLDSLKVEVEDLDQLGQVCRAILDSGKPYKYLAIDTIDKLEEWCEKKATQNYKRSNVGKNFAGDSVLTLPQGAGYLWLRNEFMKWIDSFRKLADHVILVSHLKVSSIEKNGAEYQIKDIDLTGKIKNMVSAMADAIGYIYRSKDGKMMISFKSNDEITCGSRCEHLKDKDIEFNWEKIFIDKK